MWLRRIWSFSSSTRCSRSRRRTAYVAPFIAGSAGFAFMSTLTAGGGVGPAGAAVAAEVVSEEDADALAEAAADPDAAEAAAPLAGAPADEGRHGKRENQGQDHRHSTSHAEDPLLWSVSPESPVGSSKASFSCARPPAFPSQHADMRGARESICSAIRGWQQRAPGDCVPLGSPKDDTISAGWRILPRSRLLSPGLGVASYRVCVGFAVLFARLLQGAVEIARPIGRRSFALLARSILHGGHDLADGAYDAYGTVCAHRTLGPTR